ncbi:hypothetical protein BGX27_010100 [Mortierella sp. AM989]|nr:hypothetical protein BGX27_010100 [Mortierella sp. AM989]
MMIENINYQGIFDKINKIRSYGLSNILTIPQIAILGDQSSGKSSVLEAITKLSFPRDNETCTSFATQVSMRRSEKVEMSARIDDEPAFNERYHAQETEWDIHTIITDAKGILCSSVAISEKVLEITISGPTLTPLTIIDLPGYINTTVDGQDKSIIGIIRDINTRYMKDSRTIILAVVPANVDLNNSTALGEAEHYDPSNERTIPIVTKPDTVEEDLLPGLVNTLLNRRKKMSLGYLVMKNSPFKEINIPWEQARLSEEKYFKSKELWKQVPDSRKGRVSVKNFLGDLLYTHIKKELPLLKKEIRDLITQVDNEIIKMGPPVSDPAVAKTKYIGCVMSLENSLTASLSGSYSSEYINRYKSDPIGQDSNESDDNYEPIKLKGDHRFIRSSLWILYDRYSQAMNGDKFMLPTEEINNLVQRYKGNELPGFISFTTFTQIYKETLDCWHDMTKAHIESMHQYLCEGITNFIEFDADPALKDIFLQEFNEFYRAQTMHINDVVEKIFIDESTPFTLNKYYYDNIRNSRHEKEVDNIQEHLDKFQNNSGYSTERVKLEKTDVNYNEQFAVEDLKEQLRSYCKVARKRIVDIVLLQTIERHMIKDIKIYFRNLIAVDGNTISTQLLESDLTTKTRLELQVRATMLKKSLYEL